MENQTHSQQRASHVWKVLSWSAELLRKDLSWKVGNDRQTRLWIDVWLVKTPLQSLSRQPLDDDMLSKNVCTIGWRIRGGIGTAQLITSVINLAQTRLSHDQQ